MYISPLILPNFNYSNYILFIYPGFYSVFTYIQNAHISYICKNSGLNSGDMALNLCINLRRFNNLTMLDLPAHKQCFAIYKFILWNFIRFICFARHGVLVGVL